MGNTHSKKEKREPARQYRGSPQNPHKLWAHYHPGVPAPERAGPSSSTADQPTRRSGKTSGKSVGFRLAPVSAARSKKEEEDLVADFLDFNRPFLNEYVIEWISLGEVENWLFKKLSKSYAATERVKNKMKTSSSADVNEAGSVPQISAILDKKEAFLDIIKRLEGESNELTVLGEVARCISLAVKADACRVFKLSSDTPDFVQYFVVKPGNSPTEVPHLTRADEALTSLVLTAAKLGTTMYLTKEGDPERFPEFPSDLFEEPSILTLDGDYVMYQPILAADGRTSCVVEMWHHHQLTPAEEALSSHALVWGGLVLYFCNLYFDKKRERTMTDFLLDVVKAIFEEMVSLDQLIKRILEFAQRLVNADRASLFLVDYRNFELVSTVFDLKFDPGNGKDDVEKKEIRMPINRGIAGHVALSGETMNIPDAYADSRFNREVDEKTGYKTVSILCMPIKVQGKVIGVVQMVNKRDDDIFHHEDEVAFEIFSSFFGLALHHARLYDRIMRKEQKYKVALEVLSYHNTCKENEVQTILSDTEGVTAHLNDFYFDPYNLDEFEKCKAVITMFDDLFDLSNFDVLTITRFILTVKKNYRMVPYHNFDHGWSVAHCVYVILKNDVKQRYSYKQRLALFVACLCHDLDHRGYTNKYMSETASPLAAMYSTSTLEHHHFNITVTILQQDGHNIFSHFSSQDYKEILRSIRQCILATDLAAFFPNLAKMKDLYEGDKFTWSNDKHRDLAMAITMTSADLSASAKPWEIQIETVKVIFEEFYDQGDKERQAGRTPISMMDRNKPDEQPASQVGFLSQICVPCYKMLYKILPKTKPMYVMALKNLHNWKSKARRIRNGEAQGVEVEEVSEEVLLGEETEEKEDNANAAAVVDEHVEAVVLVTAGDPQSPAVSWEEEEIAINSEDKIGGRLFKDIEGVTWLEEEGVADRNNGELLFKNNLGSNSI